MKNNYYTPFFDLSYGQNLRTYKSKIVDENGSPIFGVIIYIPSSGYGTSTNDQGVFTLPPLDPTAEVQISYQGKIRSYTVDTLPGVISISIIEELDPVIIQAEAETNNNQTLKYIGLGILAIAVLSLVFKPKTIKTAI